MFVDVELHGELTRGQTTADRRPTAITLHNADVCMDIDGLRFEATFWPKSKGAGRAIFGCLHALDVERTTPVASGTASRAIAKGLR